VGPSARRPSPQQPAHQRVPDQGRALAVLLLPSGGQVLAALLAHNAEATAILAGAFAERILEEWRNRLKGFPGQWTVVQDTLEVAADEQTIANGYVQDCLTADAIVDLKVRGVVA
jgi:hypothetical protein